MTSRRNLIIIVVLVFAVVIGGIILLTATTNPENFPPYASALAFIRAAGANQDDTAVAYLTEPMRAWVAANCPQGVSACVSAYIPPEWGTFRNVIFRRAEPRESTYDVDVISTYERDLGYGGVCIYLRVVQVGQAWLIDGWAGWVSCGDDGSRLMANNLAAPNRVIPNDFTSPTIDSESTSPVITETPTANANFVATETPLPTDTPLTPTPVPTLNAASIESAVDFIEAVGAQDNLGAQRLMDPYFRIWIADNCTQGAIATCLNFLLPDEWGALVSAVFQRATLINDEWFIEMITQFEQGINVGGICMYVRMTNFEGTWLVAGWGGWLRCNDPLAQNMTTNPDVPNRAP